MRVGIIQSSYFPWRGYFDFINSVDLFIFYDDVQYSKNGWRNRNRLKTAEGLRWITVPVRGRSLKQQIQHTEIDDREDWRKRHLALFKEAYGNAPFFKQALALLEDLNSVNDKTISELNIRLIKSVCASLEITTPLKQSSEWNLEGTKTDRLLDLLRQVKAKTYLSGGSADEYLEKDKFREAGIQLEYKTYDYEPYPQLWGAFEGSVSILDLIANCGPEARSFISSTTNHQVVVS